MTSVARPHLLVIAAPLALLGGALISQYVFGLHPCEMCLWQRWPHAAALVLATAALAVKGGNRVALVALAAVSVLVSGLIGGFHAGVEYGWWEGLTTCSTAPGGSGSGDILADIMAAPLVRCDVAPWSLFGISLAGYNFILSSLAALAVLAMLGKRSAR